ncbi:PQQ-binding-like beta-propeller repeat protein [Streptomyces sp. SBT349]|uniref:outer membrane protein assembly factor BamB family protein n=1 Tax=Streptomyces sp. SBT349 TaxID=1580539 RepID=UPI00066EBF98|nr:PQQ-binding-like beta-propeller repeat protein [Streptomyces sp. SBT349]
MRNEPTPLDRRRFLLAGGGTVGAAAVGLTTGAGAARATPAAGPDPARGAGFALLGDTQIDVSVPDRTAWVTGVYQDIAAAGPPFVLHVGDIVEHGSAEEYDAYLGTLPAGLRPRIRHVPGNHEWRWDATAGERYRALFGPSRYSFDALGIHFVGLDPSHLLQEPGGFGRAGVEWLERDLRRVGRDRPVVLLSHFPFGGPNVYVSDTERLLDVVRAHNVRAIFAGHIHAEEVGRFNGTTQLTVRDARSGPRWYWVEKAEEAGGPVLRVTAVERAADGTVTRREAADVPLTGPRPGAGARPRRVDLDPAAVAAGTLGVTVRLPRGAGPLTTSARVHPQHTYGGRNAEGWLDLAAGDRGGSATGALDVSALAPGTHRATVRVTGEDGAWHEETLGFTVPGASGRVRWSEELGHPVQGGLTAHGGLVVAATTGGGVLAGEPDRHRLRRRWSARTGPVYGQPAFAPGGDTVYVPSADHTLTALRARDGHRRFAYDAGAPVLGSPLVTDLAGRAAVVVSAGEARHAIDADTGERLWTATGQGMFAGRAACDGDRVYTGSATGDAYAYDAADGTVVWRFSTTTRTGPYARHIYGPWYDTLEVLPGGTVLVGTVSGIFALDGATGAQRWTRAGSYGYAPKLRHEGDVVLIDDFARTVTRLDPANGEVRWTADTGVRALNTGAAVRDGIAWIPGTTGRLTAVDLADGTVRERLQLTTAHCYGAPAVVGDLLVLGDQDGTLRGVSLPA